MKLLFVSMSARVILDNSGNIYLNSHMNRKTIKRYVDICDELRMILRDSGIRCDENEAKKKYDTFPHDLAKLDICFNPFKPKWNILNLKQYKNMKKKFEENIKWSDRVIIASAVGIYSEMAIKYCKKYNKRYLLLVGGFAYESDWNHGLDGKLVAWKHELDCKRNIYEAQYGLYVTQRTLQKRYPCNGRSIGCSDVEINDLNPDILKRRIKNICNENKILKIGTIANVDDKLKGHKYVVKAISILKTKGYVFEYHLLGNGCGKKLIKYAKKYDVNDLLFFDGSKPHNEVYEWLDNIDIYIQPSFIEGLCRAIVEAMSRSCPVVCTNVGGNIELCSDRFLVRPGNVKDIVNALENMMDVSTRIEQAEKSFEMAKEFYYKDLDEKRLSFLLEFMNIS